MRSSRTKRGLRWLSLAASTLALSAAVPIAASAATTPKAAASGTLDWYGLGLPTNGWDPALSSAQAEVAEFSLVYAGLTQIDTKGNIIPDLATSWSFSANRLSVTFDLRPNLVFTDGSAVTASVVAGNIERYINQTGSTLATFLTSVKDVKAVSKYVVRFDLNTKNPELPAILAGKAGLIVGPKALANPSSLGSTADGAGPFTLTAYTAAGSATLVRNAHYWDAKDIHVANLYLSGVTSSSSSALLQALQSHQANYANIPASDVAAARAAGYTVKVYQTLGVGLLQIETTVAPFNNPKIIEAIGDAIDRNAYNSVVQGGLGFVDEEPFPPGYFAYDSQKNVADYYTYDPAKAEQLLSEAGYPGGAGLPTLTLTSAYTTSQPAWAQLIQSELLAVGIKANINSIATASGGTTQVCWYNNACSFFLESFSGREAPSETLQLMYDKSGPGNPSRSASPALERAFNRLDITQLTDPSFKPDLDNLLLLAQQQSGQLWLASRPQIIAYSSSVQGVEPRIDFQTLAGITVSS